MAYVYSATVSQGVPSNGIAPLTYTDNSTGIVGLVSRILNVYDPNDVLLFTVNMGSNPVAVVNITADGYFSFQLTTVDGGGTHGPTGCTTNFVSTSFYISVFPAEIANISTYCGNQTGQILNYSNAQNNRYAAVDAGVFGQGVLAQGLIVYANFLLNTPYYAVQ